MEVAMPDKQHIVLCFKCGVEMGYVKGGCRFVSRIGLAYYMQDGAQIICMDCAKQVKNHACYPNPRRLLELDLAMERRLYGVGDAQPV